MDQTVVVKVTTISANPNISVNIIDPVAPILQIFLLPDSPALKGIYKCPVSIVRSVEKKE